MIRPGTILGKYTVEGLIGGGGFGLVYRATQRGPAGFVQEVALKTVHPRAEDGLAALVREARIIAQLHHRNVVQVHDLAHDGEVWFLVMEFVEGVTLRELRDRKLPLWVRVGIGAEVAAGLEYAHTLRDENGGPLGLIHRDVKPSNILLGRSGAVKLADFGLAKLSLRPSEERTEVGVVKGTPAYMSPEQRLGEPATAASDIFSLAAVLHELTTGVNPAAVLVDGRARECLPSVAARARPEADEGNARALESILLRALALDPARRPPAAQVGEELRRIVIELAPASNPGRLTDALARCVEERLGLPAARHGEQPPPTRSVHDPDAERTASAGDPGAVRTASVGLQGGQPTLSASPEPSESASPEVVLATTWVEPPPLPEPEREESRWTLEEDLRRTDPDARDLAATRLERTWSREQELRRTGSSQDGEPPPHRHTRARLWQAIALLAACLLLAGAGIVLALLTRSQPSEHARGPSQPWPELGAGSRAAGPDLRLADVARTPPDLAHAASPSPDLVSERPGPRRPHLHWPRRKQVRREPRPNPPEAQPEGIGWISLNAEPWAHVYVDGRRRATTPVFRLPLPAGSHTLRLVGANRQTATRSVTIAADRHLNLGMIPLHP